MLLYTHNKSNNRTSGGQHTLSTSWIMRSTISLSIRSPNTLRTMVSSEAVLQRRGKTGRPVSMEVLCDTERKNSRDRVTWRQRIDDMSEWIRARQSTHTAKTHLPLWEKTCHCEAQYVTQFNAVAIRCMHALLSGLYIEPGKAKLKWPICCV